MDIEELREEVDLFISMLEEPPTEKLLLMSSIVRAGSTIELEFECSKKLYKSAEDAEVQAMIKGVMDAAYANFPALRQHKVKIVTYRKGEHPADDSSRDDDLDIAPSEDDDG